MSLRKIWKKLTHKERDRATYGIQRLARQEVVQTYDAIVTTNEVCDRHGTGVILRRIFGTSPGILSIRSTKLYPDHALGQSDLYFGHEGLSRPDSFTRVVAALNGNLVRRIVCVPFLPDELITAIVLKELFKAPLCVFLMDDNNIHAHGIPDELMREALSKASLRLAISPELRDAYEVKYNCKFWVVPPVVSKAAMQTNPHVPTGLNAKGPTGVLIGSLWSRAWLDMFRQTVKEAGVQVHWYGNAKAPWLKVTPEDLRQDGILDCGFLPEAELTSKVKEYLFALVPSGTLDQRDDRPEIAQLSLPTRMPYLMATSNTPMIVLGSPHTAAARFLKRFKVGMVCPYDGAALRQTVQRICHPEQQTALRATAVARSSLFSAEGLADWIWRSLETGEPCDERFEEAFCRRNGEIVTYLDPPAPKDLYGDFILLYHALRRLRRHGFAPDFVIDVGASTGIWSDTAKRVFSRARYILVEPLQSQYEHINKWYFRSNPDFETVAAAVSDQPGEAELNVSSDLYGSSLVHPTDLRSYETIRVPVRTLDQIAREKNLTGRGLLKIDVQFTEHLVLAGARQMLEQVDVLLVELSLFRYAPKALLFPEMCELIRSLGFNYYEDVGGWRSPIDGTTLQKDVLFVRDSLFVQSTHKPADREAVLGMSEPVELADAPALAAATP